MSSEAIKKKFPVITTPRRDGAFIFWDMIEPHREQAHRNHGQTLERLAERGGLGPEELVAVLEDRAYYPMKYEEAERRLGELVSNWLLMQHMTATIPGMNISVTLSEIKMINDINKGINIPK